MGKDLFIQLIAIIALVAFAGSFQARTRRSILLWQIISIFFWVVHYFLLGALAGALLIFANGIITIVFVYTESRRWLRSVWTLGISLLLVLGVGVYSWNGYSSVWSLLGVASIIFAKWQINPKHIKLISIIASVFWIVYDVFVGSWGGIVTESVIISSIIVSLIRVSPMSPGRFEKKT